MWDRQVSDRYFITNLHHMKISIPYYTYYCCSRSSLTWVFHKKAFLMYFLNSTGTQLQWRLFFTWTHQNTENEDVQKILYIFYIKYLLKFDVNIFHKTLLLTKNKKEFKKNKRSPTFLRNPPNEDLPLYLTGTWLTKEKNIWYIRHYS